MQKKPLIIFVAILLFVCMLSSCYKEDYYTEANWNCDRQKFITYYNQLYESKLEELKQKYNVQCETKKEHNANAEYEWDSVTYYLYNEEFTLKILMSNAVWVGHVIAELYYYGKDKPSENYEHYKYLVDFLNNYICYVSYDAKKDCNYFEELRNRAAEEGKDGIHEEFHFDDTVGSLYYSADVTSGSTEQAGYYYMMEKNDSFVKEYIGFEFKGLLKPIEGET